MSEEQESTLVETDSQENTQPAEMVDENVSSTFLDFNNPESLTPEKVKGRVDADFRKNKELQQKLDDQSRKLRELEDKNLELLKPSEVEEPSVDLAFQDEEGFRQQQEAWKASIREQANYDTQMQTRQLANEAENERKKTERLGGFLQKASNSGLGVQDMTKAAAVVVPQLSEDIQEYILDHEYGPQLLKQLATNPVEMAKFENLGSIQAGVQLNEMSKAFRKKIKSDAPPPDEPLNGSGVKPTDGYGGLLKGSSFS